MPELILDLGSCHNGDLDTLKEFAIMCSFTDVHYLKCQLFPKAIEGVNTWLDPELFKDFKRYLDAHFKSIHLFASVWETTGYQTLIESGCHAIKFAYSQRKNFLIEQALKDFKYVFVSYDHMDDIIPGTIPLLCIPRYPVTELLCMEGLFKGFKGFSDHTLGICQTIKALEQKIDWVEKHVKLDSSSCPDAKFAINFGEVENLQKIIKNLTR